MNVRLKLLLFLLVFPITFYSQGQTLKNIKAETIGEKVIITYDLEAPQRDQKFDVEIYSSHDNYRNPLRFVSGDVGKNVLPGRNRRVEWDARNELQSFDGNVTFEVRASMEMPAVSFKNPTRGTKFKRGKTYQLVWEGGSATKEYEIQLVRKGEVQQTIGTAENNRFTWAIPKKTDNAGGYTLRLVDGSQNIAESQPFTIKRKSPLALKLIPIIAVSVGAGVYFMLNAIEPEPGPTPTPVIEDPLPSPPSPPSGG